MIRAIAVVMLLWPALLCAAPETALLLPADPRDFERLGQWERACDAYSRLLADDRHQPEIRERLALCIRHWRQSRRHADHHYRAHVESMPLSQALTLYSDVVSTLQSNYVDASQVASDRLFQGGLDEVRFAFVDPLFSREHLTGTSQAALADARERLRSSSSRTFADGRALRQAVRDFAWEMQQLTGVSASVVVLEFAFGACHALDSATVLLPPGRSQHEATLASELAAFGIAIKSEDGVIVDRVAPGSWASNQGLRPGDRIERVVRRAAERWTVDGALDLLGGGGPPIVELAIAPADGSDPLTIAAPDHLPSVFDVGIERDGIGIIRLAGFQKSTPQEFDSALLRLRSEGLRVLVLDLRGNGGGSFAAAVQIAERFLSDGIIVSTFGQLRGLSRVFRAQNSGAFDMPLVVIIDADTASAAEILAGALKDHQRAVLVGQATFGKDTIQRLMQLAEGGAIRMTLARFLLPGGKPFAGIGVVPHVVEPRRNPAHDHQLEAALEQAARLLLMR